ncbi:MAG: UDP-N-acetylmuramyl-tripeptide synthetase [Candidatus Magasanikbacteria bacterium]|nr:UDP-N-acetylmuramyl-tripeptide synthetase [Candidatus Magasanikbacteria bacterium]MBT4221286.1 UDP-N-acetylmuramyl-tripeptide synthetase [Candidatus Magasanikbacteria bacterium]MBT4350432.1 UDP-N-acetylmuramyl-tripeptide synthetase [Candidatus Magasanikbacteria bacterium]MBT4542021.1 UDP-N-acetylmuramyl-tripeptide synthetase [Candidatus Magasanikbacteria bacterium]MBT6253410.1 UDP-N-acetylmuramyl-tripeptide synthetase [Candidatus Magasanikbacteria bacterium]
MINIKGILKKVLPKRLYCLRHKYIEWKSAKHYRFPSEELIVIGITGTSGKSTTTMLLRKLLEKAGHTVASLSTIDFYIAGDNQLNDQKMTMLGRGQSQKFLRKAIKKECTIAIIESTSEGVLQYRHQYINYDMMVLTNLYAEHIDSHGSFENYKKAKQVLFSHLAKGKRKNIKGINIPKTIIVNGEVKEADEFLDVGGDQIGVFARNDKELHIEKSRLDQAKHLILGRDVIANKEGLHFFVDKKEFHAPMYGEHNVMNILTAMTIARSLDISWEDIEKTVKAYTNVPGRMEQIQEADQHGFKVIVDYAFEPVAMAKLYDILPLFTPKQIIHVLGATGGGRDIERRFTVGKFVGEKADIVIVTDEDPYDDDPREIMDDVASAVRKTGKKDNETLYIIEKRDEAIVKAITLAKEGDLVVITGKGSEQAMVVKGELIPWDDRSIARKAIKKTYT